VNKLLINNPIKKKPLFSIITVVKNDQNNIEKTIKSVAHQSFKDFEYIIIDGRSTDQTITNINKLKEKINLLISEKDMGIYYAMNKGIKLASGEIVVFINSGDLFTKNALKIVYNKFYKKKKLITFLELY
jgi:glycosyltransferase involved in cell wall biosynthesis